jgi:hypothetical protein
MRRGSFFLFILLCIANLYTYAQTNTQSSFTVYGISAAAENDLELVEYYVNMVMDSQYYSEGYSRGYFQEYVFYNNGDVPHKVGLGVWYQYEGDIPTELFRINGIKVQHQQDYANKMGVSAVGFFAFIEVVFPVRENVKITVDDLSYISNLDNSFIFKGSPRFTATIGNQWIRGRPYFEIEEYWINDIFFNSRTESLVSMLEERGSLSNDLFTIHKTDGSTWGIVFTRRFVDAPRSTLASDIEWGKWGRTGGFYNPLWENRGFVFDSEEKITPYQYIFLTNRQLQVVRNAYYARHGYMFRNTALGSMYECRELSSRRFGNIHYRENPNFTEAMLTETDRANIAIIQRLEALAGN